MQVQMPVRLQLRPGQHVAKAEMRQFNRKFYAHVQPWIGLPGMMKVFHEKKKKSALRRPPQPFFQVCAQRLTHFAAAALRHRAVSRSFGEQFRELLTKTERLPVQEKLDAAIFRGWQNLLHFLQALQDLPAFVQVDRAPVVRIDQAEVPDFVSLKDFWDPWGGQFQQRLGKRIEHAERLVPGNKSAKILQKIGIA